MRQVEGKAYCHLYNAQVMMFEPTIIKSLRAEIQIETSGKDGREMRRDEILRARNAEREEGIKEHCAKKEEKTIAGLVTVVRARFK